MSCFSMDVSAAITQFNLRWMIRQDMNEVLKIEQESFPKDNQWTEDRFSTEMRKRNCIGKVVEMNNQIVVGFCITDLNPDNICILRMAVDPQWRRFGLGSKMMEKVRSQLKLPARRTHILVDLSTDTSDSVDIARAFLGRYDFVRIVEGPSEVVVTAMTIADAQAVQEIENDFFANRHGEAGDISSILDGGRWRGIVARNGTSLLGYALYQHDHVGVAINGEYGLIVHPHYRRQGVGTKLFKHLVRLGVPIELHDINLFCRAQYGFLRAMGVPVSRYVTVNWDGRTRT